MTDTILKYFPTISVDQQEKFMALKGLYETWNSRINVVSRKDMENFVIHHLLHSLSIAKIIEFSKGTQILDVGTGGGFPGIPLSILFPDSDFTLLDSIEKKITVVRSIAEELDLKNVTPLRCRVEEEKRQYSFIVSRAVTAFPAFVRITGKNIRSMGINSLPNGIIYLKGGDLDEELAPFKKRVKVWNISNYYSEPFFETKKIVYLPV